MVRNGARRAIMAVGVVLLVAGLRLPNPAWVAHAQAQTSQVTFTLNLADVPEERRNEVSAQTVQIFLSRLLGLGLPDPNVLQQAVGSVSVVVPPEADLDEVTATLAGRGLVGFRERDESGAGWKIIEERGSDGTPKPLTSAYFTRKATVTHDQRLGRPEVAFELTEEGAVLMEAASRRLVDKGMGIFYDDQLVIAPIVRGALRSHGIIAGLSVADAKRLAVQLNSGPLPVDVTLQP